MRDAASAQPPIQGARPMTVLVALGDIAAVTKRNVLHLWRVPQLLFFSSVQPVMFVLLFRYVFGGAIQVPGGNYTNYLLPGIFIQIALFGGASTSVGLATDFKGGIIDRMRTLPMARSAVLAGRTFADLARNVAFASRAARSLTPSAFCSCSRSDTHSPGYSPPSVSRSRTRKLLNWRGSSPYSRWYSRARPSYRSRPCRGGSRHGLTTSRYPSRSTPPGRSSAASPPGTGCGSS